MRNFRKDAGIALILLAVALLLAQMVRVERTNPPVRSEISADPAVKSLLRRACYNCHSNETVWPWYAHVAPASWLVASDVNEGRRQLNLSEWGTYDDDTKFDKLKNIEEEVQKGEMPLWYYSIMHRDSRLTAAERSQIEAWTAAASGPAAK